MSKDKRQSADKMPRVGITPDRGALGSGRSGEQLLFLRERYFGAILDAGGLPLLLPITAAPAAIRAMLDSLDGVLVSGGDFDIHPGLYGEEPTASLGTVKSERTEFEMEVISMALTRGLPLFGVCGGAQAINVFLGGTLYQDIATQVPNAIAHQQGAIREIGGHSIKIHEGTRLKEIVGRSSLEVNTTHHQAVKKLGKGLIANATTEDGLIEGIESEDDAFVLGVQWHPELLIHRDIFQRKLFSAFVSACRAAG
jgi:putative glutamine amidotransferase